MPRWAILGSILVHVGVAAVILYVARKGPEHAATVISVFEPAHPKPPPPKKAEEPKPPPPKPIAHQVEAPEPIAAPPPPPPAPIAAQPPPMHAGGHPVALGGLEFGNGGDDSGPGLAVGGGGHGVAIPESRLRTKQLKPTSLAAEAPCLEEPTKPEPIFKPDIGYTDEARKSGIEGKLKLKFTVGNDGAVAKVDVVTSLDPGMDAAAVVTALKWRFKPSTRCGRSVAGGTYFWQGRFELGD